MERQCSASISSAARIPSHKLARIRSQKSRAAMIHYFRERALAQRHHRRSNGKRLERDERAGLGHERGDQQAARGCKQRPLAFTADRANVTTGETEARLHHPLEIVLMLAIREYVSCNNEGNARLRRHMERDMDPFLGTNAPQQQYEIALALHEGRYIDRRSIWNERQQVRIDADRFVLRSGDAVEPRAGPLRMQRAVRIPARWQMQGSSIGAPGPGRYS